MTDGVSREDMLGTLGEYEALFGSLGFASIFSRRRRICTSTVRVSPIYS